MLPPRRVARPIEARTIIGLDPSVSAYGWAVLRVLEGAAPTVEAAGCIRTPAYDEHSGLYVFEHDGSRIDTIATAVMNVLDHGRRIGGLTVALEAPVGAQSAGAAKMLAFAYATTRAVCAAQRLRPIALRAAEVKHAMTGDSDAEKRQVAAGVARLIGWRSSADTRPEAEAETDAVAVALTALRAKRPS